MTKLLATMGVLQVVVGPLVYSVALSAIHETLGAISVGMGL